MYSRVLIFLLLAMYQSHGTLSFVFGPLAAFTTPQATSTTTTTAPSNSPWAAEADVTTPIPRRRPPPTRRRPYPIRESANIIFPSSDLFPSFSPQDAKEKQRNATEQRLSPDLKPRPLRPKQPGHGSNDAIFFDGPTSSENSGARVRPTRHPLVFPTAASAPVNPGQDLVMNMEPDAADMASPPPACMCPTTSEANPICAEIQGERVTMSNLSEFKCAQICLGPSVTVTLIFHGNCQRSIVKLTPFIHD